LIDGTGNKARDIMLGAEDLGERVGEGRCGLNGDKVVFSNVIAMSSRLISFSILTMLAIDRKDIRVVETESSLALVVRDSPSDLQDIPVKGTTTAHDNIA
jgi:hypothetical protein